MNFELEEDTYEGGNDDIHEVEKKLYKCPVCGHINEEKAFKTYEDTE